MLLNSWKRTLETFFRRQAGASRISRHRRGKGGRVSLFGSTVISPFHPSIAPPCVARRSHGYRLNGTVESFESRILLATASIVPQTGGVISQAGDPAAQGGETNGVQGMSSDGRYAVFVSTGRTLVPGQIDGSSVSKDVFLMDFQTSTVRLVDHTGDGLTTSNQGALNPVISADGSTVLFESTSTDLVQGHGPSGNNLYRYDVASGVVSLVSHTAKDPLAYATTNGSFDARISDDGKTLIYTSTSNNVVGGVVDTNNAEDLFVYNANSNSSRLVTHIAGSVSATASSISLVPGSASISGNGAKIVYYSNLTNLVTGQVDVNQMRDLFIYDVATSVTSLVSHSSTSVTSTGNGLPGDGKVRTSISADGGLVVYDTLSTDVVEAVTDNNGQTDTYLYETATGKNSLITVSATNSLQTGNGGSFDPVISADGSEIALRSAATDLINGLTLNSAVPLYLYMVGQSQPTLITHVPGSPLVAASDAPNSSVYDPAPKFSNDGLTIVYAGPYTNLASGQIDTNGIVDTFLYHVGSDTSDLVSHAATSLITTSNFLGTNAGGLFVSGDGSKVLFQSTSSNLDGDVSDGNVSPDVFVYDSASRVNVLISHRFQQPSASAYGSSSENVSDSSGYYDRVVSQDGTYVVFASDAPNVVPGQVDNNRGTDIFVRNTRTNITRLVSHAVGVFDSTAANTPSTGKFSISDDGQTIVFSSSATDLTADAYSETDIGTEQIFAYDVSTELVTLVSHAAGSTSASNGLASNPHISGNGAKVVYESSASNLFPNQVGSSEDGIYVFDIASNSTVIVSHVAGSSSTVAAAAYLSPAGVTISRDGSTIAYYSTARDLISDQIDPNSTIDLFVYHVNNGVNKLVTHPAGSPETASGTTSYSVPSISDDGNWIAYADDAQNVVAGESDSNGGLRDVYLYSGQTNTSTLVSRKFGTTTVTSSGDSSSPSLSGDGTKVSFLSTSNDLASGLTTLNTSQVYVYDTNTGLCTLVSHSSSSDTTASSGTVASAYLSGNGTKIVFQSTGDNLVAGVSDTNSASDIFQYDLTTRKNVLLSHASGNDYASGNSGSQNPSIATDGSLAVFETSASDLFAYDENQSTDVVFTVSSAFLPQVYTVVNTWNSGVGSLRQAIIESNAHYGTDTVAFNIPGSGVQTIYLGSVLPAIIDTVIIDGTSQPGYRNTPLIQLNGAQVGNVDGNIPLYSFYNGLDLYASGSTIRGLTIENFTGVGVFVRGSNNTISSNYIGTAQYAGPAGVVHYYRGEDAAWDSIGGNNGTFNNGAGLTTDGFVGNGFQFSTNQYVDLGYHSSFDTPHNMSVSTWVKFDSFHDFEYLLGNLSSDGNVSQGALTESVDASGQYRLGWKQTTDEGALVSYSDPINGILTAADTTTNLQLNTWYHVAVVRDDSAKTVKMYVNGLLNGVATYSGNVVGLSGNTYLGNANAEQQTSGLTGTLDEVGFYNRALSQSEIQAAYKLDTVGDSLGRKGAFVGGGNDWGVVIKSGSGNTIGTNGDGLNDGIEGNVISGNANIGIAVGGDPINTVDNVIAGNLVGTDLTGTSPLGNYADNIRLENGQRTRIGTNADGRSDSAERNVISGALTGSGIFVDGSGNTGAIVAGNFIGTDISGRVAIGNQSNGVEIFNSSSNTIGGVTAASRNVISGNQGQGVKISGFQATSNVIEGNWIGVDVSGNSGLGNLTGIELSSGTYGNVVGGLTGTSGSPKPGTGPGNVISGNTTQISLFADASDTIAGNLVGPGIDGSRIPDSQQGIVLVNSVNDLIGLSDIRSRNVIATETYNFLAVDDSGTRIYNNFVGLDTSGQINLNPAANSVFTGTRDIRIGDANAGNVWVGGIQASPDEASDGMLSSWTLKGNRFGTSADGNRDLAGYTYINLNSVQSLNVGGMSPGEGNQFSDILHVEHGNVAVVVGNTFGLNAAGTSALAGSVASATFYDVSYITLGSTTANSRNVFASSADYGVKIYGADSKYGSVQGNYFGTDITGRAILGAFRDAIIVGDSASATVIDGNVIAQSSDAGIFVDGGAPGAANSLPDGSVAWFSAENNFDNRAGTQPGGTGTNVGFTSGVGGGQAFSFQRGTGAQVASTGYDYLLNANSLSVEGWIKPASLPSEDGARFTIAGNSNGNSTLFQYSLTNHNGSLQLALTYRLDSSDLVTAYSTNLPGLYTSGFHHVAVVADGSLVKFYLDGQDVSGGDPVYQTPVSFKSTYGTLFVGGMANTDGFDGAIDELAVYNRPLTSDEITHIFEAGGNDKGGNGVQNVSITGNTIGLLADGMTKGSVWDGIHILNSRSNTVSSANSSSGNILNVISSAVHSAINLDGKDTTGNSIDSNVIGLDRSGSMSRGNNLGIVLQRGAANNQISDNTIASNQIGVEFDPSAGLNNRLTRNAIGVSGHGNIVGVHDRFNPVDLYNYGDDNEVAYNTTGYQGQGAFTRFNSFHDNTELAVDVGNPGVTLTGSSDGLGMAIIDKAVLNADGTLTVGGFSPFPNAYISIGVTGPTATGFGQSQSPIYIQLFQEGSIGDQDSGTGTYPSTFNGHQVAVSPFTANRFQFTFEHFPSEGVVNPKFYVGMTLTAMAAGRPATSNEFGPIAMVSDGSNAGSGGQVVSGVAPQIYLPDSVYSSSTGILDFAGGYFVDSDSQSWAVTVDYGDGTGSRSISYQAADAGGGSPRPG